MNILILGQNKKGGTDYVLQCAKYSLSEKNHNVYFTGNTSEIPKNNFDLVIIPTSRLKDIPLISNPITKKNTKVLVWAMGSRAFHGAYYNQTIRDNKKNISKKILDSLVKITIKQLLQSNSLIFTDEVGLHSDIPNVKDIEIDYDQIIYPIPINKNKEKTSIINNKPLKTIAWIGRIDKDFKILPLLQLIEDIQTCISKQIIEKNILFIIIGSGDAVNILQNKLNTIDNIKFEIHNWMEMDMLKKTLINRVDILYAMGSSVVLGASLGIPSVVVNPYGSTLEYQLDNYRWIDETDGHSLGEFPQVNSHPPQIKKNIFQIFDNLDLKQRSERAVIFSKKFEDEFVFNRLNQRHRPLHLKPQTWFLLLALTILDKIKKYIKIIFKTNNK